MTTADRAIRAARRHAGLTQAELARRLGTSQSAVAQLERPTSNPTLATLERVLHAAGHGLELQARPINPSFDDAQIAGQLRMTPEQRLASFEGAYRSVREIARAGARSRGELA